LKIETTEHKYEIETKLKHEKYGKKCTKSDIGLLKLKTSIQFDGQVHSICLPIETKLNSSMTLTVAGFGMTKTEDRSDVMLATNVVEVDHNDCTEDYKKSSFNFTVQSGHLCAIGFNGIQSDS